VEYDDIVIGSGLAALGTVIGLPVRRRILVIGGPRVGSNVYYAGGRVPCAHIGFGGLGNFWHGVIPTAGRGQLAVDRETFADLAEYFHPGAGLPERLGEPYYFVPWQALRPPREWRRLQQARGEYLAIVHEVAERFDVADNGFSVRTGDSTYRAARLWIAAGALHTPRLLDRSLAAVVSRPTVSDHVLCYLGQVDRGKHPAVPAPWVERNRQGVWFRCRYDQAQTGLYSMRPARFGYARLDHGIQQRSAFGLPTGGAVAKILRNGSAGLIAEALFNRCGLFPNARMQSTYAQIQVKDAYAVSLDQPAPVMRPEVIQAAIAQARAQAPWPELIPSREPQLFIPVIHLHHSVSTAALQRLGFGGPAARLRVLDASVHEDIGPEHHSFKMMAAACAAARRSS
jgi:hypothetical protein